MPRSHITELWKKAEAMVFHVQEHLNPEEYAVFLDMIDPLPEPQPEVKPAKKARKKPASKKSPRASSLEQQIQTRARRGPTVSGFADDTDMQRCEFVRDDNKVCGLLPDHNVHHLQSAMGYHEFDAGKPTAPTASDSSSANGGASGGTASSGTQTESVAVAAGGSSDG